mmetsp:Transcript_1020/g.1568  ORF Transcript_1020/g.1568 Transcript_1020/m.1568 type:complete len:169 (-) Transcript_1020:202-708(-)
MTLRRTAKLNRAVTMITGKVTFCNLGKIIGRRWRRINVNAEDIAEYVIAAASDKARYQKEMIVYNKERKAAYKIQEKPIAAISNPNEKEFGQVSSEIDSDTSSFPRQLQFFCQAFPTSHLNHGGTEQFSLRFLHNYNQEHFPQDPFQPNHVTSSPSQSSQSLYCLITY